LGHVPVVRYIYTYVVLEYQHMEAMKQGGSEIEALSIGCIKLGDEKGKSKTLSHA
jgi:hypothetical protein